MQVANSCEDIVYPDSNITAIVLDALGPRCPSRVIVICTVIIYPLILVVGIIGNVCTCLVIVLNKSMRTPTNYYLFSLAISDLLMLILGLPVELYGLLNPAYPYQFGELTCKLRAFLIEFTSYASILTITSFSVERWLAICFPLQAKQFSTLDRAVKMIVGIWVGAFMAAFPVFFIVIINRMELPDDIQNYPHWFGSVTVDNQTILGTDFCALDMKSMSVQRSFILVAFFTFFLLPAVVITAVYLHILYKIHQTDRYLVGEQQGKTCNRQSLIRMLATVVVIFFVCWIPFHIQRLMAIFFPNLDPTKETDLFSIFCSFLFYVSGYFYYSNSALNPVVYNIMSTKFRRAFLKTILCWKCSDNFYRSVNLSINSKNRNSISRYSVTVRTRSVSRIENSSARKKYSVDSAISVQHLTPMTKLI